MAKRILIVEDEPDLITFFQIGTCRRAVVSWMWHPTATRLFGVRASCAPTWC